MSILSALPSLTISLLSASSDGTVPTQKSWPSIETPNFVYSNPRKIFLYSYIWWLSIYFPPFTVVVVSLGALEINLGAIEGSIYQDF